MSENRTPVDPEYAEQAIHTRVSIYPGLDGFTSILEITQHNRTINRVVHGSFKTKRDAFEAGWSEMREWFNEKLDRQHRIELAERLRPF